MLLGLSGMCKLVPISRACENWSFKNIYKKNWFGGSLTMLNRRLYLHGGNLLWKTGRKGDWGKKRMFLPNWNLLRVFCPGMSFEAGCPDFTVSTLFPDLPDSVISESHPKGGRMPKMKRALAKHIPNERLGVPSNTLVVSHPWLTVSLPRSGKVRLTWAIQSSFELPIS